MKVYCEYNNKIQFNNLSCTMTVISCCYDNFQLNWSVDATSTLGRECRAGRKGIELSIEEERKETERNICMYKIKNLGHAQQQKSATRVPRKTRKKGNINDEPAINFTFSDGCFVSMWKIISTMRFTNNIQKNKRRRKKWTQKIIL